MLIGNVFVFTDDDNFPFSDASSPDKDVFEVNSDGLHSFVQPIPTASLWSGVVKLFSVNKKDKLF